jgi:uncharacterized protein
MRRSLLLVCSLFLFASQSVASQIVAEKPPSSRPSPAATRSASHELGQNTDAASHTRHAMRDQVNAGLVGVMSRGMEGTELWEVTDLAASLSKPDNHLRILPIAGKGAVQNATDIVFARGVDIGIVQSDVLAALKRDPPFPEVENYVRYITKLYDEEIHLLAANQIQSIEDLAGKKVNLGIRDSGTLFTGRAIFSALGIKVEETNFPQPAALDKLRRGEISALVCLTPKPAGYFRDIQPDEKLHFLSIGANADLPQSYTSTTLTAKDYPQLIEANAPVNTLAVGTILVAYNWPLGSERYEKVANFVQAFFNRLHDFQAPPHHPKWRDINLSASVPGWRRFAAAEQWMRKAGIESREPTRYANRNEGMTPGRTERLSSQEGDATPGEALRDPRQRNALFAEFAAYRKGQSLQKASMDSRQRDALFAEFVAYTNGKSLQ